MEKAKRRVRVCLICVVMIAVIMGIFYYYHELNKEGIQAEGTLVSTISSEWKHSCQ